jgi:hypothetical protein
MTEGEWLSGCDPDDLLQVVMRGPAWERRKQSLLGVAACRRVWPLLREPLVQDAVDLLEGLADDRAAAHVVKEMAKRLLELNVDEDMRRRRFHRDPAFGLEVDLATSALECPGQIGLVLRRCVEAVGKAAFQENRDESARNSRPAASAMELARFDEQAAQCDLVRDLFGNPFRPVAFAAAWRSADAVAVARSIYDERGFEPARMSVLADALADAGCDAAAVLDHCRGHSPHVRGCWVVDAVLDRG